MLCGGAHTSLGRTDNALVQGARIMHHDNANYNPRPHSGLQYPVQTRNTIQPAHISTLSTMYQQRTHRTSRKGHPTKALAFLIPLRPARSADPIPLRSK